MRVRRHSIERTVPSRLLRSPAPRGFYRRPSGILCALHHNQDILTRRSIGAAGHAGEETPPPPSGDYLLEIGWTNSLGQTEAAITDGGKGKWTYDPPAGDFGPPWGCGIPPMMALRVVAPGDVNWLGVGNVLEREQHAPGGNYCGHLTFFNLFPAPAAGQFWVVRYYFASDCIAARNHAACFWPSGAIEAVHWGSHFVGLTFPNYGLESGWFNTDLSGSHSSWQPWTAPHGGAYLGLVAGTWYRYEFIIAWYGPNQLRVYPRLYSMAGVLLADYTYMREGWTGTWMSDYYTGGGYMHRRPDFSGDDNVRCMSFGDGQTIAYGGHIWWADCKARMGTGITDFIGA